jgi:signal transduction histidine kinase
MNDPIRILVIDDSEDDRELYRRALQKNANRRYDIREAGDGDMGLSRIEECAPDCVLLDYSLPGRNGIEVLKRIHAGRPFLPVVMLTGQGNETVAVTAMREGAQNYIAKSTITPDAIQNVVRVAIEHCAMEKRIDEQRTSLEIFTRALAHDLKEPVRTIKSFLDLLVAGETMSERGKSHFTHIQNAADRMGSLIDTVYFYTRLDGSDEEIPKEACDVAAVLEDAKENVGELIRERKPLITSDPLPYVKANRMQLLQVLQNLLCNAIYYCTDNPKIHIDVDEEGDYCLFRFSDNGPGIDEAQREKLFQPFARLANRGVKGLGLGLAICKKIIESHGGRIWYEFAPPRGTTFLFTLPKAEPIPGQADSQRNILAANGAGAPGEATLANVLLVDDNEADLELAQIMLGEKARLRCNFLVAHDAYEAFDILRGKDQNAGAVDLILLDINMPGMNGLEFLGHMRAEDTFSSLPVVMCSTSAYDKDITRAAELGALGYITKPTELGKLKPMLDKASGLRLSQQGDGYLLLRAA